MKVVIRVVKGMLWTVVTVTGLLILLQIKELFEAVTRIIAMPFVIGKLNNEGKVVYLADMTFGIIWYGVLILIFVLCLKLALAKPKNEKISN